MWTKRFSPPTPSSKGPATSEDRYGLPLGARPSRAVEDYVTAADALLSGNVGADEALDRALAADPDFALAHAAKARALQMRGAAAEAKAAAARARLTAATWPRSRAVATWPR